MTAERRSQPPDGPAGDRGRPSTDGTPTMIASLAVALSLLAAGRPTSPAPASPRCRSSTRCSPTTRSSSATSRADLGLDRPRGAGEGQPSPASRSRPRRPTSGKWLVKLGPYPAGGPHTLNVAGPKTVEVGDILVGDVWLCSGQSNMEWPVNGSDRADDEVAAADHPPIRLFTVPKKRRSRPRRRSTASWDVCAPQTVGEFSAVGYFFGRDLQRELNVPIGLIDSSWGGTIAEAWIAAEALEKIGDFDKALAQVRAAATTQAPSSRSLRPVAGDLVERERPGTRRRPPGPPRLRRRRLEVDGPPGNWEGRGLAEFDGIVWFRREVTLPERGRASRSTSSSGRSTTATPPTSTASRSATATSGTPSATTRSAPGWPGPGGT